MPHRTARDARSQRGWACSTQRGWRLTSRLELARIQGAPRAHRPSRAADRRGRGLRPGEEPNDQPPKRVRRKESFSYEKEGQWMKLARLDSSRMLARLTIGRRLLPLVLATACL